MDALIFGNLSWPISIVLGGQIIKTLKQGVKMKPSLCCILSFLALSAMGIGVVGAIDLGNKQITFKGELQDSKGEAVPNGQVVVTKNGATYEAVTDQNGVFSLQLPTTGPFDVEYSADGFIPLPQPGITIEDGKSIVTQLKKESASVKQKKNESVGGLWVVLLALPGLFGLLVAWVAEMHRLKHPASPRTHHRLAVSLLNGLIWAVVLSVIWCLNAIPEGVTKVQLFHRDLTFEFYVPMLGLFGALLYVFDLLRSGSDDEFKSKEFGMRIIMAPYVAIVMVALFGKELGFIDLSSHTGQGSLAFFSGLLVIVALQGLIERANEFLGRWRRQTGYKPSPIANRFKLSEAEDMQLRRITIRHPGQLIERDASQLKEDARKVGFDESLIDWMIREVEREQLYSDVGDIVWKRLEPLKVKNLQEYANLEDNPIHQVADNEKPALSKQRLLGLRDRARQLYSSNNQ
jgi:hypothetical protein